jgi:hypothetical protein
MRVVLVGRSLKIGGIRQWLRVRVGLYLPRTAEEEVAEEVVLLMSPSLNFASFFAAFWSSERVRPEQH